MHTFVTGRARARRSTFLAGAAGLLLIASVAACTSGSTNAIFVSGAWARTSSAMASAGAGYLVIKNNGTADDALTGGSSSVAGAVEVHETVDMSSALPSAMPSAGGTGMGGGMASPAASGSMGGTTGGSMMGMQKIDRLVIPAGGSVELKPGSYHLMLLNLTQELKAGTVVEITLDFEKAGPMKVSFEVRAN
ncbi:MAG: copper chaperone PCu(A)C [Chloroflexota bacterium]